MITQYLFKEILRISQLHKLRYYNYAQKRNLLNFHELNLFNVVSKQYNFVKFDFVNFFVAKKTRIVKKRF